MSYQFHKIKSYSRTAAKSSSKGFSAQDIANESERKPSACKHVDEPKPPTLLFGVMPSQAVKRAHEWAAQAKDVRGSKLRQDGLCILAGVVSVGKGDFDKWNEYKRAVIDDLLDQFGDRLQSVVEHNDEAYPHLHYYMVPKDGEAFEKVHTGLKAKFAAKYAKKTTGEQNLAYKAAMKNFQTGFYERVSKSFGLLRDGPKRERLSTPEWRVKQAAAKRDAAMIKETEARCQALTLAALEASANQSAAERVDALAQLKIEMESLRINNQRECELKTKAEMDKAKAETQAAALVKAEAAQKIAQADDKVKKVKGQAEVFIKNTKAAAEKIKQQARTKGYADGKSEAVTKWGGVAGAISFVQEAITGDKAEAVAELEARHQVERQKAEALIKSHHSAALKATQGESVAQQCSQQDRMALVAEKEKTALLEQRVHELEHPQQRQQQRQNNAPAPKM